MKLTNTRKPHSYCALLAALSLLPAMAATIPAELPAPDAKPPTTNKPVKVYIQSGQSNSLGFGRVEGAAPVYANVYLSPDPVVKTTAIPIGNSVIFAHGLFQSMATDAKPGGLAKVYAGTFDSEAALAGKKPVKEEIIALGGADKMLPSQGGPHAVVVEGAIEVPYGGMFKVHVGYEGSSHAVGLVNGQEVYRKTAGKEAVFTEVRLQKGKRYPIKLTFLKGGAATFWLEKADNQGMGDLRWYIEKIGKYKSLMNDKGEWVSRNDVMLNDAYMGKGASKPMSAPACGSTFGPELGFGWVMGEFHDEPVIVIKADIGNRSLGWDMLPPGTESWEHEGVVNPGYGFRLGDDGKPVKAEPGQWYAGKQYDDYTASIRAVLDNFGEKYPQYKEQGFEIAGFVWWQGHKDGPNPSHNAAYEKNLANLIKAWRKEFNAPKVPWVIATVGFHGEDMVPEYIKIADAQMAVADPKKHPEFAGTVKTIDTRPFWRPAGASPKDQFYHYNHNADTYMLTGDTLGRAMVELKGGKVEYMDPKMEESIDYIPIINRWGTKKEELADLNNVLRPIIVDTIIPVYVENASSVARHRRNGMFLSTVLSKQAPDKIPESLSTQLDKVIGYYQMAGIDDYSWKNADPEMQKVDWNYYMFDAKEPLLNPKKSLVRYREIALPEGMERWFSPDFDPAKAGWKVGKSPFSQYNGKLAPLKDVCGVSHCGCDIPPATLWDKEVLLMQQKFKFGKFDANRRYRIVVGGAGHKWSGEGMALYINGKLASEAASGNYKNGGGPRGAFVFEDLEQELMNGEVTIAVKSFLRRSSHLSREAPPTGHLSVFLQSALLPPPVIAFDAKSKKK